MGLVCCKQSKNDTERDSYVDAHKSSKNQKLENFTKNGPDSTQTEGINIEIKDKEKSDIMLKKANIDMVGQQTYVRKQTSMADQIKASPLNRKATQDFQKVLSFKSY